jgi:hypothetical protein
MIPTVRREDAAAADAADAEDLANHYEVLILNGVSVPVDLDQAMREAYRTVHLRVWIRSVVARRVSSQPPRGTLFNGARLGQAWQKTNGRSAHVPTLRLAMDANAKKDAHAPQVSTVSYEPSI